ncbi:PA0069 family radical SAM protein [Methylogaea oryzae]|uniref:Radical SAM protein n=1 Tax=Methylogaea oryzae TaxID=1295382 RepID=A0A8D5AMF8_9GAMM|nr:PA0069 family radical SAM protein [Methylogaea oryzae]BBL71055.1 radical SAM protein [Methylogaea oryzae]
MTYSPHTPLKGRGTASNADSRYGLHRRETVDDGWNTLEEEPPRLATTVTVETAKRILSRNASPDIPFDQSINAYRGCEHGCIYCYARPTHAYMDLSPGLDFESKLFAKPDAARLLRSELRKRGYRCTPIALGANTDPYQPIEKDWRITRQILEVLAETRHPVTITTKAALVERDMDLLAQLAADHLVQVQISITTLDKDLARRLEPRASSPRRRLQAIESLSRAGVPVGVMVAPVIPVLTDSEMEAILSAAAQAGAVHAGYQLLRLPLEVAELFQAWLKEQEPLKAEHVMSRVRDAREGRDNDSRFETRQLGTGAYAGLLRQRFRLAERKAGLAADFPALNTALFKPPLLPGEQMSLF